MFNIRKLAQKVSPFKKSPRAKPYEKHLHDNNEGHGLKSDPHNGVTDWQLQQQGHKNKDNLVPFEEQLGAARADVNAHVLEKALDENPQLYATRRLPKVWDTKIKSIDMLAEAYDQARNAAYSRVNKGEFDAPLQNENPGSQMLGPKTKIKGNVQPSQLENHPDRFQGLENKYPIHTDVSKNRKTLDKSDNIKDLAVAGALHHLKSADAMLFHIFATAAEEGREITAHEHQMVKDINSSKARLLSFAQWFDDSSLSLNDYQVKAFLVQNASSDPLVGAIYQKVGQNPNALSLITAMFQSFMNDPGLISRFRNWLTQQSNAQAQPQQQTDPAAAPAAMHQQVA